MKNHSQALYSGLSDPSRWSLPEALSEMAQRYPDRIWISDQTGQSMTFAAADNRAGKVASFFLSLGIERSDRVAIFMAGGCEFALAWFGLARAGITSVTINTDLHGEFLRHQLRDSGVRCIVVDQGLLPRIHDLVDGLPDLETIIVKGESDNLPFGSRTVRSFADYASHEEIVKREIAPSDIACIMYTSGTSGPSKGVLMPHAHCTLFGIGQIECMQISPDDRFYICLPLFHANGLFMQLGATVLAGIPAFVRSQFSASNWLPDIVACGATVTNLIGSTAAFVIAQPSSALDRKHGLRVVLASPNLPQHEEQFRARFGVPHVVSGFGMTEVNIPMWGRLDTPAPGAAGWVHEDHFEACIVDPETDRRLGPREVGEIVVRPKVPFGFMAGYLNVPEKTVEAWRNLWFHTGDAGTVDETGLFTFIDRIKDCIRRRGENISATEIELIVENLPGVAEVAAYAVPADIPGAEDEVMLAIVPETDSSLDGSKIVEMASRELPRFARPRYLKFVDQLPKTATGKVKRALLRKEGSQGAQDFGR